ncbi:MAG TPA: MOSC domain-containing protein [Burkholderiales bacterium]|nr:MOSC domain-containing protein [Burkholderiales bacterium]
MQVVALYRYPVKGFTPEACEALTVLDEGRIAGDRALAFRFGNSPAPDNSWSRKHECVVLANTPGLARVTARFDHEALRLRLSLSGAVLAEAALDDDGRRRLGVALASYVLTLGENPLSAHPERLPLRLVGDGRTPRYQDYEGGQATLHGRGSLAAVAAATGDPGLDEARFRSNIIVDGLEPWEEQGWMGRKLRIGDVEFEVARQKVRCLATHANPRTGRRDVAVMPTLMKAFSQKEPTFAVGMTARGAGGEIRLGDEVRLLG